MASRQFTQRHLVPLLTSGMIFGIVFYPVTILKAESPEGKWLKKPIYDDNNNVSTPKNTTTPLSACIETRKNPQRPTATDRLTVEIGKARLFLYAHISFLEQKVNQYMDSAFLLEESFTSTIASLAPASHTGEKIMPGALYVLVAAMTGSIIARKRNILIRAFLPLTTGITAGWILLPITFQNISNLVWKYEQRFPTIADSHIRTREAIDKSERMARIHSQQVVQIVNEKISASRSAIEDWISKGK